MSHIAESRHYRHRSSSAAVIALVTAAMLAGCGHSGGGSSSPDDGASSSDPAQPAAMPHGCTKTGPVVFAVSGRADSPAPTLTTTMQTAATVTVGDGSPIGIVDVDGDPALIKAGAFSDKGANPIALANDQQAYLSSLAAAIQATRATHPDVDVLDALEVAGRALHAACDYGGTIYLEDSGLQETGAVNFRQGILGAAPGDVVSFLAKEGELPELRGLNVVLVGIGDTAPPQQPLSIGQRDNLIATWTAIAKAGGAVSVSVDPSPRNGVLAPENVPPVQLVPVPAMQAWAPSDHTYVFPDEGPVGFLPNLAKFRDPAAAIAALRALGTYLAANPSVRIKLTGTTARVPPLSGCIALSLQRAAAVRRVLLTYGAHLDQISIAGVGWEFPGYDNDQGPGGVLLPGPAEHNRSVIVTEL